MPVETPTDFIEDLNPSFPESGDSVSEGDNHTRNIKEAIQGSFPNTNGAWNVEQEATFDGLQRKDGGSYIHHKSGLASGEITVQSGGSPAGGSNGDIWLIY